MDEFEDRCSRSKKILSDESIPMWIRIDRALMAWKGLELTGLKPDTRAKLNKHLVAINTIFSRYEISSAQDYRHMSLDDLDAIASELREIG